MEFPSKATHSTMSFFFLGYFIWLHKLFGQQWNFLAKQLIKQHMQKVKVICSDYVQLYQALTACIFVFYLDRLLPLPP